MEITNIIPELIILVFVIITFIIEINKINKFDKKLKLEMQEFEKQFNN